jgi:uncharacterized protein (TIGR02266 family)
MRLRPAAVPSVDPAPASVGGDLLEQEQAALDSERLLSAEAAAMGREIAELTAQAEGLAARAEQLRTMGLPAAEWLLARIHTHRLQPPDLSGPMAQAQAARAEALTARARAVEASRVLLRATGSALAEHRAALGKDHAELEKARAVAEAARLEAELRAAEARAQAELRAAAAAQSAHPQAERRAAAPAESGRARPQEAARKRSETDAGSGPLRPSEPTQQYGAQSGDHPGGSDGSRRHDGRETLEGARPESSDGRREAEIGRQGKQGTTSPGGLRHQTLGRMTAPRAEQAGQRECARVPLQAAVDLASDSNLFTGFGTNVSEGGLFVATINVLPVGTPVDLTFTLPGKSKLSVHGEVRWTREVNDRTPEVFPGVGVRFVNLAPATAEALKRFVSEREPLFYPD